MRQTSRNYAAPYRPALVRALSPWLPQRALRPGELIDEARRSSGLVRFEDESFIAPLEKLCASLESEARLSPVGRLMTRARIVGSIVVLLRVSEARVPDRPIAQPLFVTGLQRSGTTMLHRLLSADPSARALATWEALNPALSVPRWRRLGTALAAEKVLRYLAPDFFAVHPIEARKAEEEVVVLDHTFLSTVAEASYHVPSFAAWLEEQDHEPAYRHLRRVLQLLGPDARWVLKTPHHLEHIDTLRRVFPDARIIQTHRDPTITIASFCSMVAHGRGIMSDHVDPHEVGRHWQRKIARMLELSQKHRSEPWLDVRYDDLVDDPMAQVERVYAFIGRPLTVSLRATMAQHRRANRQHKFGKHVYALSDFGLEKGPLAEAFRPFTEMDTATDAP